MLERVLEENGVNIRSVHTRPSELATSSQPRPTAPERTQGRNVEMQIGEEQNTNMNVDDGVYL